MCEQAREPCSNWQRHGVVVRMGPMAANPQRKLHDVKVKTQMKVRNVVSAIAKHMLRRSRRPDMSAVAVEISSAWKPVT